MLFRSFILLLPLYLDNYIVSPFSLIILLKKKILTSFGGLSKVMVSTEWPSSKNLQTINAGEGVEKGEPSCAVGGNVN